MREFIFKNQENTILLSVLFLGMLLWAFRPNSAFFSSKCDFEEEQEYWSYSKDSLTAENSLSRKFSQKIDFSKEFSATFSVNLDTILSQPNCEITAETHAFLMDESANPMLVISIEKNTGENIKWVKVDFKKYISVSNSWQKVFLSTFLSDVNFNNALLKVYVWNLHKDAFFIDDIVVKIKEREKIALCKRD